MKNIGDVLTEIEQILKNNNIALYVKRGDFFVAQDKGDGNIDTKSLDVDFIGAATPLAGISFDEGDSTEDDEMNEYRYSGVYYGSCI